MLKRLTLEQTFPEAFIFYCEKSQQTGNKTSKTFL